MITVDEQKQVKDLKEELEKAVQPTFGKGFQSIVCYVYDDEIDAIKGIFAGNKAFWSFSISSNDVLSYEKLKINTRLDSNDPFWIGVRQARQDGVQIKKNCKSGVSVTCGESCIPIGAICHEGLPSAQQARVRVVRAVLKASRKVAKTAAVVALGIGVTALAVFATKKAQDGNLGEKVRRTAEGLGMKREAVEGMQNFASKVAEGMLPKPVSEAMRSATERQSAPKPATTLLGKLGQNTRASAQMYVAQWQHAPVKTALGHASVGLLLLGVEQYGEQLGYIPEGSLKRAVGAEAMHERFRDESKVHTEPVRVTNRTTNWGG